MKTLLTLFLLLFVTALSHAQDPFVTVWNTQEFGISANDQISFGATGDFDYTWMDTDDESITGSGSGSDSTTITFPAPGIYELSITPTGSTPFSRIALGHLYDYTDGEKLLEVKNWGDVEWSTWRYAFGGTQNLTVTATDLPDLGNVTDMSSAFYFSNVQTIPNINEWDVSQVTDMEMMFYVSFFNQPIGDWDVSSVTNMYYMFSRSLFNQPIGNWDVGNVTDFVGMFHESPFNQPIGAWDMSSATNLAMMFYLTPFNQAIGEWDVSGVTNMSSMFGGSNFNQPIGDWDVGAVTNMAYMFVGTPFNQPIGDWDVSGVTDMDSMFGTSAFNHPIGGWDVANVTNMYSMFVNSFFNHSLDAWDLNSLEDANQIFRNSGMDCQNYSLTLRGWADNPNTNTGVVMWFNNGVEYSMSVVDDRDHLINELGWIIGGDVLGDCSIGPFVTLWNTENPGISENNQISFAATGDFNYVWVDISDVSITGSGTGSDSTTITFPAPGIYGLGINPTGSSPFNSISFSHEFPDDAQKILEIRNWGSVAWNTFHSMLAGTFNLSITATEAPNLANVTDMADAFRNSGISEVPNMNGWDVSLVTTMQGMFAECPNFDQAIGGLSLSALTTADSIFYQSGMSCQNYSSTLEGWAGNPNTNAGVTMLSNNDMIYNPEAGDARALLINTLDWSISGDGFGYCSIGSEFITLWNTQSILGVSENNQISFGAVGDFDYTWYSAGDESITGSGTGSDSTTITFPEPGVYELLITPGVFT